MKADMIIVLQNGKIIETGNHNELLKNKKIYRKIADLQLGDNITKK
jgi:ATP-binding cassette subfamily B protein